MNLSPSSVSPVQSAGDKMLALIRQKYPSYHPVMAMADMAHKSGDEKTQLACHQTIAKYVIPELKSIQIDAKIEQHRRVTVELFEVMTRKELPKVTEVLENELNDPYKAYGSEPTSDAVMAAVEDAVRTQAPRMILEGDSE